MRALLDTCVLSGLRHPAHATLLKNAMQFFDAQDLFLSVISIGEITKGIALLPASKKKKELQSWALQLENVYADRLLNITSEVVHIWGELSAQAKLKGISIPTSDGLIAATALAHGLHVMTRNVADFQSSGVLLLNPWE